MHKATNRFMQRPKSVSQSGYRKGRRGKVSKRPLPKIHDIKGRAELEVVSKHVAWGQSKGEAKASPSTFKHT
jgi:hypothetical protein